MVQEKGEKDFMAMFFYAVKTRAQPHLRLPTKATKSKSAEFRGGFFLARALLSEKLPASVKQTCIVFLALIIKIHRERKKTQMSKRLARFFCFSSSSYESLPLLLGKKKKMCEGRRPDRLRWASASLGFSERLLR